MANATKTQDVDEPSVLGQLFTAFMKWCLLRLWAYPTVALILFAVLALIGLVVGQRWLQLIFLVVLVAGAYAADRFLMQGRVLASYLRWASARAAIYRVRFMWDDLMDRLGLFYKTPDGAIYRPRVRHVVESDGNLRITFDSLSTQHLGDFDALADRFRTAFQGRRVALIEKAAGTYELRVTRNDPLAHGATISPTSVLPATVSGVQLGILETGRPMVMPLDQAHSLLGGIPGAGKSVTLNVAMAGISRIPSVQMIGIDCRRGMEFTDWSPRLSALAIDQESALELLRDVKRMAIARADALTAAGYRKQSDKGYTVDEPLFVLVIDECAELFDTSTSDAKKNAAELVGLVSQLVRVYGRAGGVSVVLATQKPTTDALPSIIRDNVSWRSAFRCKTPEQARAIFGDTSAKSVSPTSIAADQKGYCVVEDDDANLVMGRSAFITAQSVREFAALSAHLRRPLSDFLPREPEGDDA